MERYSIPVTLSPQQRRILLQKYNCLLYTSCKSECLIDIEQLDLRLALWEYRRY